MNNRWFYRQIANDALLISSITWVLLFVMEIIKPGIVSNYLSLTRAAAFVLILGVCSLTIGEHKQPLANQVIPPSFWTSSWLLAIVSLLAGLVVYLFMPPSPAYLTVLVVSVTVLCVWIGTHVFRKV